MGIVWSIIFFVLYLVSLFVVHRKVEPAGKEKVEDEVVENQVSNEENVWFNIMNFLTKFYNLKIIRLFIFY